MSVPCQKATFAPAAKTSLFDYVVGESGYRAVVLLLCLETRQHARLALDVARQTLLERCGIGVIVVGLSGTFGGRRIQIAFCRFGTSPGELGQDWPRRCGRR